MEMSAMEVAMRNSLKLLVAFILTTQVFAAGPALSDRLTLGEGLKACGGTQKGVGCGGCVNNKQGGCYVISCDKTGCDAEWFRRVPRNPKGIFRGNVRGASG
jgi:hypothetical protein